MSSEKEPFFTEIMADTEEFRDHIATVDEHGKRIWLYPKKPKGRFYNARQWVSFAFLAIFLTMPFIRVGGQQFLQFNILERHFVLFGVVFTPQDFYLFGLVMLTFLVFIILFTVVYGRLFCGWVCPQTVFMEMFFRRIEYAIEGDATQQRKLDASAWTVEKIRKKLLKHAVFFVIGVVVSNYFLAYIIGTEAVLKIIREPVGQHVGGFSAMLFFSFLFYGVFARMREQVCTTICPYGRLQGVLLVKDSIVVAYDYMRGEPRGKLKKTVDGGGLTADGGASKSLKTNPIDSIQAAVRKGDCVDCKLCIAVCPTGIDIRNGTQLECTNCTACIDACDEVMDKISRPRGLIRYDSMTGIETGKRKLFTPRVLGYSAVLVALALVDVVALLNRGVVESIILRAPGQLYQQKDETHVTNLYTFEIISKSPEPLPFELRLTQPAGGKIEYVGQPAQVVEKAGEKASGAFFIELENSQTQGRKTPVVIEVYSGGKKIDEVKTNFMAPVQ